MTVMAKDAAVRVHSSLLYLGNRPLAGPEMAESLVPLLASLGLPVERRLSDGDTGLSLRTSGPEVLIHAADKPLNPRITGRLRRPEGENDAEIARRLGRHRGHVTIRIADRPGRAKVVLTQAQRVALIQRLVRHLMAYARVDFVVWHPTDTLYTTAEFKMSGLTRARRAAKKLPPIVDEDLSEARSIFDQLESRMPKREEVANSLPDLPRRMTDGNEKLREIFRVASAGRPRREVLARLELAEPDADDGVVEKLSVYVMNGTIMVMSFPAGMGLLTYNILKGGDLKATARMMALTGTALGLLTHLPSLLSSI